MSDELTVRAPSTPDDVDPLLRAAVLDALPDAALLIDDLGDIVWGNRAAIDLFGIGFAEGVGRSGLDFVHPDDLSIALLSMQSMQGKSVGSLLELRMKVADGTYRLMEMRGGRLADQIVLCVRDLTERRRWELASDDTSRLSTLLHHATTLMLALHEDGTVHRGSAGLSRLLGRDQEWLELRPLADLVAPGDHGVLDGVLDGVRRGSTSPVTVDLRLLHADGREVPFALTFENHLDDPVAPGIVATGHDVTDRVRTEAELRHTNSVLGATLESTTDGILVVDLEGRITSFNSRFVELWRLPDDVVETRDDDHLLSAVLDQLLDPASFVAKVQELYAQPEAASRDTIEFRDGRVFERDSLPQRVDGVVVGRVWSFRDMTEQVRLQNELAHQAFHDPLTGLANQALFRDRLSLATARLGRSGGQLAVLFIDLDDFKTVNDSLGHSAGDALLVMVSQRLTSCLRPGDTAARLGGDEFAVLVDDLASEDDAVGVAERILAVLQDAVPVGTTRVTPSASIGIAYGTATAGVDELLRNADLAMYTAKAAGKNCFQVFADEMHAAAVERLDLEARLRGAAERGELVIHYQPIVELGTGRIAAMEALVRWRHPERGLLGPLSFIPFAEEGGLIDEIGQHVLDTAVQEAVTWAREVGAGLAPAVSVNISPRQLMDAELPDRVELLLHRSGLHPAQLIMEITEGALMQDPVAATQSLERLSRLGVRLAVDDFGTGYSSLAYLQQFPIDVLKVDGSFIDDGIAAPGCSLAEAIIQIAKALDLVPVAEGVETEVQARALRDAGCGLAQGYHLGRPMEVGAARQLIVEEARRARDAGDAQLVHPAG